MAIRLENITKTFKDADRTLTIISQLSINFPVGKTIAIVGRSGVGKSTLLQMLGGLEQASSGKIIFNQTEVSALQGDDLSDFRGQNIGFVFQFHHLLPEFNAQENVALPLLVAGAAEPEALAEAGRLLTAVGLNERLLHKPGQLSGGEQQRVAIARALIHKPTLVLADEPTGSLDVNTGKEVSELLVQMIKAVNSTLIVVTHTQEVADLMDLVFEMLPQGQMRLIKGDLGGLS